MSDAGEPDIDLFIENMVKVRDELKDKGSTNISKAQQDQKKYYDKRHSPEVCMQDIILTNPLMSQYYQHAGVKTWHKSLG